MNKAWDLFKRHESSNTLLCTTKLDLSCREQREELIRAAEARTYPFLAFQTDSYKQRLATLGEDSLIPIRTQ